MNKSFYKVTLIISIGYIAIVSAFLLWHRSWFSPDQFFAVAILATLILGRAKQFVIDWFPLTGLILGYEYLRSLVPKLTIAAHIFPMINFDKFFFGEIPAVKLQNMLFTVSKLHWYDYLSVLLYISYFVVPMAVGFVFWLSDRERFKVYSIAFLALHYLAFITFVIFPAMPPWMASQQGYLPPIRDISSQVMAHFPTGVSLPTVYSFFGANLVAAVPSLHAAFPWLIFLFIAGRVKKWSLFFIPYVLGVWFAVIYLGEHYVFDILVGIVYATAVFLVITKHPIFLLKGGESNE